MVMKLDHDDLNRLIEKISSSDIQEFSLEGEDFKLEIKRNLFNNNQSTDYLSAQNSLEKQQIIATKNSSSDNRNICKILINTIDLNLKKFI